MASVERHERPSDFSIWLRTGRWPEPVEVKFNPWHDPRNGQFTFAPGGPRSLERVIVSDRRQARTEASSSGAGKRRPVSFDAPKTDGRAAPVTADAALVGAVYRPGVDDAVLRPAQFPRNPRSRQGGNSRAFHDPMTLQQAVPGLRDAPGGAVIGLVDNVFDLTGPAAEMTTAMSRDYANRLMTDIRALEPEARFDSLGFPTTRAGQMAYIDHLRFQRAAVILRTRDDTGPMQVETMRFIQARADQAYVEGERLLNRAHSSRICRVNWRWVTTLTFRSVVRCVASTTNMASKLLAEGRSV